MAEPAPKPDAPTSEGERPTEDAPADASRESADASVEAQSRGEAGDPKPAKGAKGERTKPAPKPLPGAGTPDGAKLREAVRAYDVGDLARVRARVADLRNAADPAVREVAEDLARRIAIDPIQLIVIAACALVLAAFASIWIF